MTNLQEELSQFYGSETFYRHPLFRKFVYTEGVQYLAEKSGAYWLLEYIFSNQMDEKIKAEEFQVWKIKVKEDNTAVIRVEDGNDNLVKQFELEFTDFPLKEFTLWFSNNTLLLPSEW